MGQMNAYLTLHKRPQAGVVRASMGEALAHQASGGLTVDLLIGTCYSAHVQPPTVAGTGPSSG